MFNALLKLINQQKQKSKKGFTLVELIVVIAILGILAALVVPSVTGYVKKAQEATDEANAQMLYSAAQLYITDKDVAGDPVTEVSADDLKNNGYIQKVPDGTIKFTVTAATKDTTTGKETAKASVKLEYTPATKGTTTKIEIGK